MPSNNRQSRPSMLSAADTTQHIQSRLLETAFALHRILKHLTDLHVTLPLRGEASDHSLNIGPPTVEFCLDGTILCSIEELEQVAQNLITAARTTDLKLRREHASQRDDKG